MQNLVIKLNQSHRGVNRQSGPVFQKEDLLSELPFSSKNNCHVPSMPFADTRPKNTCSYEIMV